MSTPEEIEARVTVTKAITDKLVEISIEQINDKYSDEYHKQNPHLLSTFIELNKSIYLATS